MNTYFTNTNSDTIQPKVETTTTKIIAIDAQFVKASRLPIFDGIDDILPIHNHATSNWNANFQGHPLNKPVAFDHLHQYTATIFCVSSSNNNKYEYTNRNLPKLALRRKPKKPNK